MSKAVFPGAEIPQAIDVRDEGDEAGEPALWLVLKESEARKIVRALENGHAYEVVAILKNQPWWDNLSAAVRGLAKGTRTEWVSSEL